MRGAWCVVRGAGTPAAVRTGVEELLLRGELGLEPAAAPLATRIWEGGKVWSQTELAKSRKVVLPLLLPFGI